MTRRVSQERHRVHVRATCVPLALQCRALGQPEPIPEHAFAKEAMGRRWRFDYAWPVHRLALEVQGGLFIAGRHSRGAGLVKEHEKLNAAAALGWRVLYCTPRQIANGEAVLIVDAALKQGA